MALTRNTDRDNDLRRDAAMGLTGVVHSLRARGQLDHLPPGTLALLDEYLAAATKGVQFSQ